MAADINETCYTKATFTDCPPGLADGQGTVFTLIYGTGWRRQVFYTAHSVQGLRPSSYERISASDPVAYGDWIGPFATAADLEWKVDGRAVIFTPNGDDRLIDFIKNQIGRGVLAGAIQIFGGHPQDVPSEIGSYGLCKYQKHGDNYVEVRVTTDGDLNWFCNKFSIAELPLRWLFDWVSFATATPPEEDDLPLAAGYTSSAGFVSVYSRDQLSRLHVEFNSVQYSGVIPVGEVQIATLPPGYRPSHPVDKSLTLDNASLDSYTVRCRVYPTGVISIFVRKSGYTELYGQIEFNAG